MEQMEREIMCKRNTFGFFEGNFIISFLKPHTLCSWHSVDACCPPMAALKGQEYPSAGLGLEEDVEQGTPILLHPSPQPVSKVLQLSFLVSNPVYQH